MGVEVFSADGCDTDECEFFVGGVFSPPRAPVVGGFPFVLVGVVAKDVVFLYVGVGFSDSSENVYVVVV